MDRFEVLERLASAPGSGWSQAADIVRAARTGENGHVRRQLNAMHRYGYARRRRLYPWKRDKYGYRMSKRGRQRLGWARANGKLNLNPA